jgi:hypothetical protein
MGTWLHNTGAAGNSCFYGCSNLIAISDNKLNKAGLADATDMVARD